MQETQADILIQMLGPASYSWNSLALPMVITLLGIFSLGWLVLARERFSSVARAFFFMTLSTSIWLFCFIAMYLSRNQDVAFLWAKAAYLGVPFIPSTFYYFTLKVLRIYEGHKQSAAVAFLLSFLFSFIIVGTDVMIRELYTYSWGFYPKYRLISALYVVFFYSYMLLSLGLFWREHRKPQTETHQLRIKYLLVAFSIASFASLDYLAKFGIDFYPCGYLGIVGFISIAAQVISRYRLVDITPSMAIDKIIGAMGEALLVLDAEGIVCVANEAACKIFRRPQHRILGSPVFSINLDLPPASGAASAPDNRRYEVHHDGEGEHPKLILAVSESRIKDHLGYMIATVLVIRDITDLKKTETALQETEMRYKELYNQIPDAVILIDEFGRFRSVNQAAEEMLGFEEKELVGKIFVMSTILPSVFMNKVLKVIRSVLEGRQEQPFDLELTKEGKRLTLKAFPSAVLESGKAVAVQILLRNVAEREKFEEALKKAQIDLESRVRARLDEFFKKQGQLKIDLADFKLSD